MRMNLPMWVVYFGLGLSTGLLASTGCGGGDDAAPTDDEPGTTGTAESGSGGGNKATPSTRTQASASRKSIDGIPYDVFFDNPLQVAANTAKVGTPPGVPVPDGPKPTESDPGDKPAAAASGGTDWKALIPKEVLESEVKKIVNKLSQHTQSVGKFKQNIFQIPPDSATLAVLAAIAVDHPGDIRWKENAKQVRDLAYQTIAKEIVATQESYKAVEDPFLKIKDILAGSPPADLPTPKDGVKMSDITDFGYLMKRLDLGSKWVKTNVGSEATFKEKREEAMHEAYIIATLGKVITMPEFGYEDDGDFKAHADAMIEGGLKMVKGATEENYGDFDAGLTLVYKKCTECHGEYRE